MKYTPSHEWIHMNGDVGYVGITASAQKELGEIVYVELPTLGMHVEAGEEVVVIESTKAAADIYSPVSGVIIAVNPALQDSLDFLNKDPENDGWLFQIHISVPAELETLLTKEEYSALIQTS